MANHEPQYPAEDKERMASMDRELLRKHGEDLKVVQEVIRRMDKAIFGNGTPGFISQMEDRHVELEKRLMERQDSDRKEVNGKLDRMFYAILAGALTLAINVLLMLLKKP